MLLLSNMQGLLVLIVLVKLQMLWNRAGLLTWRRRRWRCQTRRLLPGSSGRSYSQCYSKLRSSYWSCCCLRNLLTKPQVM